MESTRIGDLTVHTWPGRHPDAPVVLAVHGITGNGLAWARVVQLLDGELTVVAPDLRGRAGSRDAGGPYGLARHADDLVTVLDGLGIDRAILTGHSMGAYICALAAVRHPDRALAAVLVDGGLTFPVPAGTDMDAVLHAVLGPAMERLQMTFPDREAYRRYWQQHPAFDGEWAPWVDEYIQYDLVDDGAGAYRSSSVLDAVRVDGGEVLLDAETHAAIHHLPVPGVLIWAERGIVNQPQGLYDRQRVAGLEIPAIAVPDTNHYSILTADRGAEVIAQQLRAAADLVREGGRPDTADASA